MSPVADTILCQLGGRMFIAMVTRKIVCGSNYITAIIGSGMAKNGANRCTVTLGSDDLYKVEFSRLWGTKLTILSEHEGIYAEKLRGLFETETKLRTSLTAIYGDI